MAKKKKAQKKTVDFKAITDAARGRWSEIIQSICSIPARYLDGRHQDCPMCGGTDRWRVYPDFEEKGGAICNQCGPKLADGINVVAWQQNCSNFEAAVKVAHYLGLEVEGNRRRELAIDQLDWRPWNDLLVYYWAVKKPPITPEAVAACGGQLARYANMLTAVAFPVRGREGTKSDPVGWVLYNSNGREMPIFGEGGIRGAVKVKTLSGSKAGLIGAIRPGSGIIYKVEGPTDVLTLVSQGLKPDESVVCNVHGSNEDPRKTSWFAEFFKGRDVVVIGDNDQPGQKGAETWGQYIAKTADQCWLAKLPGPTKADHGDDLRDYFLAGHTRADFDKLVEEASIVDPRGDEPVNEAPDDPDRLARVNLQLYKSRHGGVIRYWQGAWYVWKSETRHYERYGPERMQGKIWGAVKEEFDRLCKEEQKRYEEGGSDPDEPPPQCRKVNDNLVRNVMSAMRSRCYISDDIELNQWIDNKDGRSDNMIAMANGLLDIDAVLANRDLEDCLFPHSPDWFSTIYLPYNFDPRADWPHWREFLEKAMEGDWQKMNVLQEWAGYSLIADTSEQKMMILTGEGANGKSVFCGGIEAMLGPENCSHVQFENITERFQNTTTLGKLLNICADVSDHEMIGEGVIKNFCAGDRMMFDRKGLEPIEAVPTARLMLACNNLPRTRDKTEGLYRRILLIPWNRRVSEDEKILGMDKVTYWQREWPGIFRWALLGLNRLRQQKGFSSCRAMDEALGIYRRHNNPALEFIEVYLQPAEVTAEGPAVKTKYLFQLYKNWCEENNVRPLSHVHFGKELHRRFSGSQRARRRDGGDTRVYVYVGVDYQDGVVDYMDRDEAYTNPNGGF